MDNMFPQKNILIYGTGEYARGVAELLPEICDSRVIGFIFTDTRKEKEEIDGLPAKCLTDWDIDIESTGVFLGMALRFLPDAKKHLTEYGIKYIYKQDEKISELLNRAFKLKVQRFLDRSV